MTIATPRGHSRPEHPPHLEQGTESRLPEPCTCLPMRHRRPVGRSLWVSLLPAYLSSFTFSVPPAYPCFSPLLTFPSCRSLPEHLPTCRRMRWPLTRALHRQVPRRPRGCLWLVAHPRSRLPTSLRCWARLAARSTPQPTRIRIQCDSSSSPSATIWRKQS